MKTTGTWKHLLAISSFGAISLGATGCASETEVDESESAVGSTEVTPFDEQYFDVSVAWPSEQVSALINGDPMDVDYTPDCKFELSFRQEGETKPLLTLKGEPKDEKTASGYEGKALGSGVLTRDQLTRRAMSGSLAFRCSNDQAQRDRGATFEIPPVRFSTRLGTEQVTTVVPKMPPRSGCRRRRCRSVVRFPHGRARRRRGRAGRAGAGSLVGIGELKGLPLAVDQSFDGPEA